MKSTQRELDLDKIHTERSNIETAKKLKQQMLRKAEEKKTKKEHHKDDQSDKESAITGRGGMSKHSDLQRKMARRGTKLGIKLSKQEGNY